MRLRLRWFSRPEDRVEAWIAQRHQERVLEGSTTPPVPVLTKRSSRGLPGIPSRSL
jgi:hypothetical protein